MADVETEDRPDTGGNLPPHDVDPLMDRLNEDHADLIERRDALLGGIERAPTVIEDEDTAGKMADFVERQIRDFIKRTKVVFDDEKAPYLAGTRTCDNWKHTLLDDIEAGAKTVNKVRKTFADKKVAEERRIREEAERKARAEAAEAQRLADEAEARRVAEAAAAQRLADERAAKLREEDDLAAAIEAEAAAKSLDAANAEQAKAAEEEAARLAKVADQAKRDADAKPAQLGKSRGDYGGQTTLRQFWNFDENIDRAGVDIEALRAHLPADALTQAVRSWIRANGDALRQGAELRGVRIFEDTRL